MTYLLNALDYTDYGNPMVKPLLDWTKYAYRVIKPEANDGLLTRLGIAGKSALPLIFYTAYTFMMIEIFPDPLTVDRAENRDYKILVIGNARTGKSHLIEAMEDMSTIGGGGSLFSEPKDPSLTRFEFLDRTVAVLETQSLNDATSSTDKPRSKDEIIARIRKTVRIAFGGFKQVDAVLFTASFGDTTQIETMAELLEIFGNDLRPAAKKIAVITYCEKMPDEAVLEQYKEQSDFNKINAKFDGILPFGANELPSKGRIHSSFKYVANHVDQLYSLLFGKTADNFAQLRNDALEMVNLKFNEKHPTQQPTRVQDHNNFFA